jgi:glycosyltransferase involved in cell wall biosynthesis
MPDGLARVESSAPGSVERADAEKARVVLVHDYLLVMRGAERTFAAIAEVFAHAPIFTLLYDERGTGERFGGRSVTTSPLQRLGTRQDTFRRLLPLYPWAVGRLELPPCDLVVSSSSAFAHGVRAPAGAVHLCYCHAPFRYAWYEQARAEDETPGPLRPLLRAQLGRIRRWDLAASRRVDAYVANSRLSRERIALYWSRDASIVHPPVETERFAPAEPGDALLVVSELVRHKRLDVALEAARRARAPIQVVGTGPDFALLRDAYPQAQFLGRVDDEELADLYARARAVIVPGMEEFGITAVEAQAAGRPVIAAAAGGALETVVEGVTGTFVALDDAEAMREAIERIDRLGLDPTAAVENAQRFSTATFKRCIAEQADAALARGPRRHSAP